MLPDPDRGWPTPVFAGTHRRAESVRAHAHPCWELILVVEGHCTVDTTEGTLHAGPGDLIRMPARLMHNQVSDGFIYTIYVGFIAPGSAPGSPGSGADVPRIIPLAATEPIEQPMLLLARIHLHHVDASPAAAAALLLAVLEEAAHQDTAVDAAPAPPVQLRPVLRFIEQNIQMPLTVDRIAGEARMSPSNLHKLFRDHFGTSPMRYVMSLRMGRAEKLLRDPYLSVKEVSRLCGYADTNLFVRTFKKAHGAPPGKWRASETLTHSPIHG